MLSQVGTTTKFIEANDNVTKLRRKETPPGIFLKEFIEHISLVREKKPQLKIVPQIFTYFQEYDEWYRIWTSTTFLYCLKKFLTGSAEEFRMFCSKAMTKQNCQPVEVNTLN